MQKRWGIVIFLLISVMFVNAQKTVLTIKDSSGNDLPDIMVEILKYNDSSVLKVLLSDQQGKVDFDAVGRKKVIIRCKSLLFETSITTINILEGQENQYVITLNKKTIHTLTGVTVESKKPFIQRLNDRLVVNVENSILNAGNNALEVLSKSPGITLGSNDILAMRGKTGVIIMINGKPITMNNEELLNYLRSLPAGVIQQIDLITNPSSRYDAAGNAGIIDIKLKKDQRLGTNGTVNIGLGQGIYPKMNHALTLNSRSTKLNFYGNIGFNYVEVMNNMITRRDFFENKVFKGAYDQNNFVRRTLYLPSVRFGLDYYINKKTILGFIASGNMNFAKRKSQNRSLVLDDQNQLTSSFTTNSNANENSENYLYNFNLKHSFDSSGKEISFDLDYSRFGQDWDSRFESNYYDKLGNLNRQPYRLSSFQEGLLQIRSGKIDFVLPVNNRIKIESGLKASYVTANNLVLFYDRTNGGSLLDSSMSNRFNYREKIGAAYVSIIKKLKQWEVQLGLRSEYTSLQTKQLFTGLTLDTSYFQLFPTLFITHKKNDHSSIGVSISRRIDRPTYGQLNPFRIFVDPSFYAAGDPNLFPQLTWNYEVSYSYKSLNMGLSFSRTKLLLSSALIPAANRITVQTAYNLDRSDYLGLTLTSPIRMTKWWNTLHNLNLYYNSFHGVVAGTHIDNGFLVGLYSLNNSFSIGKNWASEVNMIYNSGGQNGVISERPNINLSVGVQKKVLQGKGNLKLNISDLLFQSFPRFSSRFDNYFERLQAVRDTRIVNVVFTYRFGNAKVQSARRRSTASEEERRRAGGN